ADVAGRRAQAAQAGARAGAAGRYTPTRRRTMISLFALLAILVLQTLLTLRLRNTAFEDEALYLYAGRMEIAHLLHGAALQGNYASYFSGAPVLYPVLGAALNMVGGLTLARTLSLAEMLAVTTMLYSITRFLFNERVALCAAALFAVSESTLFVGHLATYDATCLFLLAAAATITVRTSARRWPVFLLAAPLVALAVAVKYAGALYVPTIACLPALAGSPARGRRVLAYPLAFGLAVAALVAVGLHLGGHVYIEAIAGTTTNRIQGTTPDGAILEQSLAWGGVVTVLAVIGAVAYAWRPRTEPGELIAPAGGRVRRVLLGVVLSGTMLLAPVYQMHLHTNVSLQKHIGFGLFFAAPVAGAGLVRIVGDHFRRPHIGIALWSAALALGMSQSWSLYQAWPSTDPFVSALSRYLAPHASYLVEVPEVPIYYLEGRPDAQPDQFMSTYNITYFNRRGQELTGIPGFTAAVRAGAYKVIAYDETVTPAADQAIEEAIKDSHVYRLARVVHLSDTSGPVNYYLWTKRPAPHHHPHPKPHHPRA
ncbi:MAG: ArnT family glycosyltransferase, partial [Trebonia sp.]